MTSTALTKLPALYLAMSSLAILVYGYDKLAAMNGSRRIPESLLHLLGLGCGWPGALAARHLFRHKTVKTGFRLTFWVTATVNILALLYLLFATAGLAEAASPYLRKPLPTGTFTARVRHVSDGDTVVIDTEGRKRIKLRIYGIDAPELRRRESPGQPDANGAARVLRSKIRGRRITVSTVDTDRYGRLVGKLYLDGQDIGREMIREGHAWAYRGYLHSPDDSDYLRSEEEARNERRGIWRASSPEPPWVFRHRHR